MSSVFKKYRMTRKNVLLLAQAISNVFERFRNEFTHQMYSNVINDEMQRLESER
ncbi:hypothetical protein NE282_01765 [Leuconostoc mesenteroides]|uniref:hypothetical protein n=1 Tax=Leuconostoc mesenteroides TaxID=1245 RepID=UPI0020749047|nr:hypothetical protein [Leuconostoc mesenteroides]MCM6832647.1 hypothetical protein [Leuconostoc mesenteroides]